MLACLINGQRQAEITDVPVPRLHPGEVLIKLAVAGICGTDIEKVHGAYGPGGILGHEVSGTIARLGDEVTDLRKSDRVIAHHHVRSLPEDELRSLRTRRVLQSSRDQRHSRRCYTLTLGSKLRGRIYD